MATRGRPGAKAARGAKITRPGLTEDEIEELKEAFKSRALNIQHQIQIIEFNFPQN